MKYRIVKYTKFNAVGELISVSYVPESKGRWDLFWDREYYWDGSSLSFKTKEKALEYIEKRSRGHVAKTTKRIFPL